MRLSANAYYWITLTPTIPKRIIRRGDIRPFVGFGVEALCSLEPYKRPRIVGCKLTRAESTCDDKLSALACQDLKVELARSLGANISILPNIAHELDQCWPW